jgi:hypothetical protein
MTKYFRGKNIETDATYNVGTRLPFPLNVKTFPIPLVPSRRRRLLHHIHCHHYKLLAVAKMLIISMPIYVTFHTVFCYRHAFEVRLSTE